MYEIIQFLEEHYQEKISLQEIAKHWNYSSSYTSQLFKEYVGINFYDYLTRIRLRQATRMLSETDMRVLDIASENGFQDLDMHISLYKSMKNKEKSRETDAAGSREEVIYDVANLTDIQELVRLRILYLIDDLGSITDEEREGMEKQLPGYFERELGKKLIAFVARAEGRLVATAYLLIIEKPANPSFLNGLDSEVMSVYTEEGYRGRGICTNLMRNMIEYAREHQICRIDLVATDEGYPIYKKLGFEDKAQKYTDMRLKL